MIKNLLLSLFLLAGTWLTAQVQTKQFSLKPVGNANIAELHNKIDTFSLKRLAPAPFSSDDYADKKRALNAARELYFKKIDRRVDKDTTAADGPNLPFVEGGFVDSLFTSSIPNDNHMCVGNNGDVISVLNSTIRVYKGGSDLSYNVGLSYFGRIEAKNDWPNGKKSLTGSYDPKAMYDPVSDRFIVAWLDGRVSFDTRIVVAVSHTNDAAGGYSIYHLEGNPLDDKSWTDYPILSQSEGDIFITVNLLRDSASWQTAFKQSVIWQMDKDQLYQDRKLETTLWHNIQHNNKSIWSICPVDQYHKSPSKEMYFLSVRPSDMRNDTLFLHKISNTQRSGLAAHTYEVLKTQLDYGLAGSAFQPQANFRLQTNDSRILTAIYYYGHIQYAQNSINFETTAPSIMHGSITKPIGPWKVSNTLITSDSMDFGYPSMAYMGNGNTDHRAVLSFSHSSKTVFPGVSMVKIEKNTNVSPIIRIKAGNDIINSFIADTMERWGDYTGIQRKYDTDNVLYLSNSLGFQGKPTAGTYIGRLRFVPEASTFKDETAQVFPNPSSSGVYYYKFSTLNDASNDYYSIRVHDLGTGKIVFEREQEVMVSGELVLKLDLSFLSSGTYNLQFIRKNDINGDIDLFNERIQKY